MTTTKKTSSVCAHPLCDRPLDDECRCTEPHFCAACQSNGNATHIDGIEPHRPYSTASFLRAIAGEGAAQCTYPQTRLTYLSQWWIRCRTCGDREGEGGCLSCRKECWQQRATHDITVRYCGFYCDVGAKADAVYFYAASAPWGELSNFWPLRSPIVYQVPSGDGHGMTWSYKTSEHLYQSLKYLYSGAPHLSVEFANEIRGGSTALKAKRLAYQCTDGDWPWQKKLAKIVRSYQERGLGPPPVVSDEAKVARMRLVLRLKFDTNPGCRRVLLSTGDRPLFEHAHDCFWGDGFGGPVVGKNWMGRLLMELREKLRAEDAIDPYFLENPPLGCPPPSKRPRLGDDPEEAMDLGTASSPTSALPTPSVAVPPPNSSTNDELAPPRAQIFRRGIAVPLPVLMKLADRVSNCWDATEDQIRAACRDVAMTVPARPGQPQQDLDPFTSAAGRERLQKHLTKLAKAHLDADAAVKRRMTAAAAAATQRADSEEKADDDGDDDDGGDDKDEEEDADATLERRLTQHRTLTVGLLSDGTMTLGRAEGSAKRKRLEAEYPSNGPEHLPGPAAAPMETSDPPSEMVTDRALLDPDPYLQGLTGPQALARLGMIRTLIERRWLDPGDAGHDDDGGGGGGGGGGGDMVNRIPWLFDQVVRLTLAGGPATYDRWSRRHDDAIADSVVGGSSDGGDEPPARDTVMSG